LDEIERLRAHDLLDFAVAASLRGRDPDIADLAGGLHGAQRSQMLLPGQQIVDLQQIEAGHAPISARRLDLCGAPAAGGNPDFIGREHLGLIELAEAVADHLLRRAVHRRRIDHPSAGLEEGAHDLRAGVARDDVVADVESDPAAEPDHGQCLARRWDRPGDDRPPLGERGPRAQHGGAGDGQGAQQTATAEVLAVSHRKLSPKPPRWQQRSITPSYSAANRPKRRRFRPWRTATDADAFRPAREPKRPRVLLAQPERRILERV
jgi:hypothetical protein